MYRGIRNYVKWTVNLHILLKWLHCCITNKITFIVAIRILLNLYTKIHFFENVTSESNEFRNNSHKLFSASINSLADKFILKINYVYKYKTRTKCSMFILFCEYFASGQHFAFIFHVCVSYKKHSKTWRNYQFQIYIKPFHVREHVYT